MSKYVLSSENESNLKIIEKKSGKKYSPKDREMLQKLILFCKDERNINWKACSQEKLDKYRQLALETGDYYTYDRCLSHMNTDRIRTEIGQVYPADGITRAEMDKLIIEDGIQNQIGDNTIDLCKDTVTTPDGSTMDFYSLEGDFEKYDDMFWEHGCGWIGIGDKEVITDGYDLHLPKSSDGLIHIPMSEMSKNKLEAIIIASVIFS